MNFLKNEQIKVYLSIILGILSGLVGVSIFGLSGYMISLSYFNPPLITIIFIIVIIKLFGLSKGAFKYFERIFSHEATFQMTNRLRLDFLNQTLANHIKTRDVRLIERLNKHFDDIEGYYIRIVYPIVTAVSTVLIVIILSALVSTKLVVIFSVFSLFVLLVVPLIFKRVFERIYDEESDVESTLYLKVYSLIYGYTDFFINKEIDEKQYGIETLIERYNDKKFMRANITHIMRMTAQVLQIIGLSLIIYAVDDVLLLPMILLIFINVVELLVPVMQPVSEFSRVKETIKRIEGHSENERPFNEELSVKDLTFRYENSKRDVLKRVTLNVKRGEKHVIIGPSGSGKSTLLHHLITEDASVMPQFLDFYNGTLRDNLTMFGKNEIEADELKEYLDDFNLKELELDDYMYATRHMSAGEMKRLHAIRMILERKNTWIMDEPTARLNDILREKMWDLILKQETLIVVTHDLSHLGEFDFIHYLKDGEIVETITSDALKEESSEIKKITERFTFE